MHIFIWLLSRSTNGKLQHGSIKEAITHFNVSRKSISKIWNTGKRQRLAGQNYNFSTKYHNAGRKRIQVPSDAISALNMGDRSCIRDLASKISIGKTIVHRMIQGGEIKAHTNALHPGLKADNKKSRLSWVLGLLEGDTAHTKSQYYGMYDFVHLDEKWFYITKKTHRVYLALTEKGQYRAASSSKFIPKIMLTAVVARPRFNSEGACTFDGKIGVFPFTYKAAAKRASKYRARGTIVTKCIDSVGKDATRYVLINNIIPAIMAKWPNREGHQTIYIQQDNAKTHILQSDPEWQQAYQQPGFTFVLIQQPPNSPDLNILDLGFFRSIQSLMHKKMPKDIDRMLEAVENAFYELQPRTLDNVWMTLQYVMNEVLKDKGGNGYVLPHVNKSRLHRLEGGLATQVKAPRWTVEQAWNIVNGLQEQQQDEGIEEQLNDDDTQEA